MAAQTLQNEVKHATVGGSCSPAGSVAQSGTWRAFAFTSYGLTSNLAPGIFLSIVPQKK